MKYYSRYHVVTMNYTILKQSLLLYWKEHLDLKMLSNISKIHFFLIFSVLLKLQKMLTWNMSLTLTYR